MKKYNRALLFAGIAITVVDLVIYQVFIEKRRYVDLGPWVYCIWTFAVGLIGYSAWSKYPVKWPSIFWLFAYVAYLAIVFPIILVNRFLYPLPAAIINFLHNIRSFPNGPMPMLILYFLATYLPVGTAGVKRNTVNPE